MEKTGASSKDSSCHGSRFFEMQPKHRDTSQAWDDEGIMKMGPLPV